MSEKIDKIAEFRCKKCGSGNTFVKEGDETYKIRVCRRCGFEGKIPIESLKGNKK